MHSQEREAMEREYAAACRRLSGDWRALERGWAHRRRALRQRQRELAQRTGRLGALRDTHQGRVSGTWTRTRIASEAAGTWDGCVGTWPDLARLGLVLMTGGPPHRVKLHSPGTGEWHLDILGHTWQYQWAKGHKGWCSRTNLAAFGKTWTCIASEPIGLHTWTHLVILDITNSGTVGEAIQSEGRVSNTDLHSLGNTWHDLLLSSGILVGHIEAALAI